MKNYSGISVPCTEETLWFRLLVKLFEAEYGEKDGVNNLEDLVSVIFLLFNKNKNYKNEMSKLDYTYISKTGLSKEQIRISHKIKIYETFQSKK